MRTSVKHSVSAWRAIAVSTAAALLITLALLLGFAWLITYRDVPDGVDGAAVYISAAVGTFAGGAVCACMTRRKGLLCGAAVGMAFFALVLAAGFVLSGQPVWENALIELAASLIGGAAGGLLGVNIGALRR